MYISDQLMIHSLEIYNDIFMDILIIFKINCLQTS
jgi:hypothetical protein